MNCTEFRDSLLEDEADLQTDEAVLSHGNSCASCNQEQNLIQQVRFQFANLAVVSPPERATQHILNLLHRQPKSVSQKWGWASFWKESWFSLPVGVMAMMIVAVTVLFHQTPSTPVGSSLALKDQMSDSPFHLGGTQRFNLGSNIVFPAYENMALTALPTFVADVPEVPLSSEDLETRWKEKQKAILEAEADILMMRGRRLKAMGRVDLALNDFETITRFYPDYTYLGDVLMYRAQCYAFQGNVDKALESLDTYVQKYPDKRSVVQSMMTQLTSERQPSR